MSDHGGWYRAVGAYTTWGLFPLYFNLFRGIGAVEVVAHRIVWSLVFCLTLLLVTGGFTELRRVLAQRRATVVLLGAGLLITTNWTLYIWGITNGHTLDAALGYFINPLVNATLGVLVFRERMRPAQWVAFGIGGLAIVELVIGYGAVPWVALGLAVSFGIYGVMKKQVGGQITALPGMTVESCAATPIALGVIAWGYAHHTAAIDPLSWMGAWAVGAGVLTAVPLLLFATAAARLPLSVLGMVQYIGPICQFLCGWAVFGEQMPPSRWIGFAIIWVAIAIFVVDAARANRMSAARANRMSSEVISPEPLDGPSKR